MLLLGLAAWTPLFATDAPWARPPLLAQPSTARPAEPQVAAHFVSSPPRLDGLLDDRLWAAIEPATAFVQREPEQGTVASERTEIRFAHDGATLYIGIRALDSEPAAIIAREMRRDGRLPDDDSVELVLDTFHDHRNAYLFGTNANGALLDAQITDEGRTTNFAWDGIWRVEARRTADGWSAELAIPASTLRFDPGADTWGFNARRLIRRREEEVYWAPIERDADLFRISRAGHLTGVGSLRPGSRLRTKVFSLGSVRDAAAAEPTSDFELGGDLRWEPRRGIVVDVTANTDFAQVEADDLRTNLTRFPLFFPEKREFFLENSGLFEFGDLRPGGFGPPLFRAFFSRRIGIAGDGREVPLLAGGRLTGKTGAWSFGALDVQTRALDGDGEGFGGDRVPATNWAVTRLKRDVGARSSLGLIATRTDPAGIDSSGLLGVDADVSPHPRLNLRGFWARTDDGSAPEAGDDAFGGRAQWRTARWNASLDLMEIGERFDPRAGFLLRRGVRRISPDVFWEPRPEWPAVRSLFLGARSDVFTDLEGEVETSSTVLNLPGFQFEAGDYVESFWSFNTERLERPFEIHPGVVVPAGEYDFQDAGIFYSTDPSRALSVSGVLAAGEFFDGDHTRVNTNFAARLGRRLLLRTELNHDAVRLPAGDFDATIFRQRIDLAFSPTMFLESLVQYDATAERLAANLRYRWTYRPGADLFVVLNGADGPVAPGGPVPSETDALELIVKFTYLWSPTGENPSKES